MLETRKFSRPKMILARNNDRIASKIVQILISVEKERLERWKISCEVCEITDTRLIGWTTEMVVIRSEPFAKSSKRYFFPMAPQSIVPSHIKGAQSWEIVVNSSHELTFSHQETSLVHQIALWFTTKWNVDEISSGNLPWGTLQKANNHKRRRKSIMYCQP